MKLVALVILSVLMAFAAPALATVEEFIEACLASSNLPPPICECCAVNARERLSPLAFEFLTATLQENEGKVEALRPELSPEEATQAGMFMAKTPGECAAQIQGK